MILHTVNVVDYATPSPGMRGVDRRCVDSDMLVVGTTSCQPACMEVRQNDGSGGSGEESPSVLPRAIVEGAPFGC